MTRMTKIHMESTLFRDYRNQQSWGRAGAAVSLAVAIALSFRETPNVAVISAWLGCAFGNYGASKLTEIIASWFNRKAEVGVSGPTALGASFPSTTTPMGASAGSVSTDQGKTSCGGAK